jgi:hypothetical protein
MNVEVGRKINPHLRTVVASWGHGSLSIAELNSGFPMFGILYSLNIVKILK